MAADHRLNAGIHERVEDRVDLCTGTPNACSTPRASSVRTTTSALVFGGFLSDMLVLLVGLLGVGELGGGILAEVRLQIGLGGGKHEVEIGELLDAHT